MTLAVRYCREHDILKAFLERYGTEVMNMLYAEWNQEEALAVRYEEGWEKGREEGIEKTARNALAKGLSPELIHSITGLDLETIKGLGVE